MKKALKTIGIILGIIILFLIASNFIWISERESLFYKIQQYVTYSKEDWQNYENTEKLLAESPIESNQTDMATQVVDYHPYDVNRLPESAKEEELKKIRNAHFENLIASSASPTNEEAQEALARFTEGRLTDVIINQKLNIKIGKCYDNPNTEGNYKCVSCMILLYNTDKKDWQEAPDGKNFLDNSYDFYQSSEGGTWEAKPLSLMIPYDYDLIKKYEKK